MTEAVTPLDALCEVAFHEAGDTARAAVLRTLADTMLYAALTAEPAGEQVQLLRLPLPDSGEVVLACDDEARLAAAAGGAVPYAAMPGRVLARLLSDAGVALLLNPGAPSQMLLDHKALRWLTEVLSASAPQPDTAATATFTAPDPEVVARLAPVLGERLGDMADRVETLSLVGSGAGHLILVGGAAATDHDAIAKAFAELVAFLPPLPTAVDVGFSDAAPVVAVTLRREAPPPQPPAPQGPPRLR